MTLREAVLFCILVALGGYAFHRESVRNHRECLWLRSRARRAVEQVHRLRQQQHDLRAEANALSTDHYYVEVKLREDLGWRPLPPSPTEAPALGPEPGELARAVPRLDPTLPTPTGPPPPPPRPQVDPDRRLLAVLGYASVEHFQRKMMSGRATGTLDEATRNRARRMAALIQRLGYESVVAFQRAHSLAPDGIYGRKTEHAVLQELRRRQSIVVESGNRQSNGG